MRVVLDVFFVTSRILAFVIRIIAHLLLRCCLSNDCGKNVRFRDGREAGRRPTLISVAAIGGWGSSGINCYVSDYGNDL